MLVDVGTDAKDMHIIPYLAFVSVEYLHIRDADTMPEMLSRAMAAASSLISPSLVRGRLVGGGAHAFKPIDRTISCSVTAPWMYLHNEKTMSECCTNRKCA